MIAVVIVDSFRFVLLVDLLKAAALRRLTTKLSGPPPKGLDGQRRQVPMQGKIAEYGCAGPSQAPCSAASVFHHLLIGLSQETGGLFEQVSEFLDVLLKMLGVWRIEQPTFR